MAASKHSVAKKSRPGRASYNQVPAATSTLLNYFSVDKTKLFVKQAIEDLIVSVVGGGEPETQNIKRHGSLTVLEKTIKTWQSQYPWLDITGDVSERRLKCKICTERKVSSIWANEGSSNFQRNSIERHCSSNEHQRADAALSQSIHEMSESDNFELDDMQSVSKDDVKLFRTIFYVAKEEMPNDKINSLLELQNMNGADIKYRNLSWDTVSDIQSCICTIMQRELAEEVKSCGVYAIMIDESTDLAVQKHLSVCVRYVKNGQAVARFLSNVSLDNGKAHTIVDQVIACLTTLGLDPSHIVSLATDGASTMTGKKTGVGVQMKSKHSPFIVQTHCIAHRLNLAVVDSIKKEPILIKFRDKFNSLYYFMSGSSNRTTKLQQIQLLLGEPQITVKEPHNIRWLGLKNAVEAVYVSYNAILATLSPFAAEKQATAHGLLKYFSQYKTVLLVAFILDIHETIGILSKGFQKQNISFSEVQPLIDATLGKLQYLETNDGQALKDMRDCITIKSEEGGKYAYLDDEKLTDFSEKIEKELSSLRVNYICCLKKNIKHRFRKEDEEVYEKFSLLLEPLVVNSAKNDESEEAVEFLGRLYGENKTVKIVHADQEETTDVSKLLDKQKLQEEWPMLKGMILGAYSKLSTPALCQRVIQMHKQQMSELSKLCTISLCFALTSVECERSFSTQNRIKNKYRSSLKVQTLNNLIAISLNKTDVASYNPTKAVQLWDTKKKRRRKRLVQVYKSRETNSKKLKC